MIDIILDKEYFGPDIFELAPAIPDITDTTIKVRWTNTKDEVRTLKSFDRDFTLYVANLPTFERAISTFSKFIKIAPNMIERSKIMLMDSNTYDWRHFTEELRECSPRFLVLKLAADAIRKGLKPSLADIAVTMFVDGISPLDADVLVRLKSNRIRG